MAEGQEVVHTEEIGERVLGVSVGTVEALLKKNVSLYPFRQIVDLEI